MKTKKILFTGVIAVMIAVFAISSCKKEEEPAPIVTPPTVSPTDSTSQTTRASDQTNVENESNQAMDEANDALMGVSTTRGVQATCGYTIDSSQKAIGKITLNYDGITVCNGKKRSGSIAIQLPYNGTTITTWSTAGATSSLTFYNYKVVYTADNKSLLLNGTHTVKNVNGGGLVALYFGTPMVNKVRSHMQISFDGGTAIEWNSAKLRTITYNNGTGVLKASMAGDSIYNSENIAMWGINNMGDHFTITVPTAFSYDIWNPITNCVYKPLTGQIVYSGIAYEITLTYGVNQDGTYPFIGTCPWGYKIEWDTNNGSLYAKIPYPF
ncbi:MAG: hypothetical protein V4549_14315 [Bacteroidota bacterium]